MIAGESQDVRDAVAVMAAGGLLATITHDAEASQ